MGHAISNLALGVGQSFLCRREGGGHVFFINHISKCSGLPPQNFLTGPLKKKQKQPKSIGKGNRPNAADPLPDEDIDTFYSRKVLGIHSPRALLRGSLPKSVPLDFGLEKTFALYSYHQHYYPS